ncbi:MAG: hypothetical protein C0436_00205 [Alphaproteobacteria bacterium]|nr:hypothetical protein [Alphaproteobacteria bacterium]
MSRTTCRTCGSYEIRTFCVRCGELDDHDAEVIAEAKACFVKGLDDLLRGWLSFSQDVQAHDPISAEELEKLRSRTVAMINEGGGE